MGKKLKINKSCSRKFTQNLVINYLTFTYGKLNKTYNESLYVYKS